MEADPAFELEELTQIYVARGLEQGLARQVAGQLMAKDALGAHARDELNISDMTAARPVQAALASAAAFSAGAILPIGVVLVSPQSALTPAVIGASLVFLAALGAAGARLGGARASRAILRVVFWGALAMGATALIGRLFGAVV